MLNNANSDDNQSKLLKLIDSTIAHQRNEMDELQNRWEELRNEDDLCMIIDSFIVQPAMGRFNYNISITCKNPSDLKIWRQCLITALEKIDSHGTIKIALGKVTVSDVYDVEKMLQFLEPFASKLQITNVEFKNIPSEIIQAFKKFLDAASNPNEAEQLPFMELVLENIKGDFQKLLNISESIKKNENQNQKLWSFCVYRDDKWSERTVLTASGEDSTQIRMWIPCLKQALVDVADSSFQIDGKSQRASAAFNTDDTGKVLRCIKPLVQITVFDSIYFRCLKPKIVRLFTNFMDGASVPFMMIYTKSFRQPGDVNAASYEELTQNEEKIENNCWIQFVKMAKVVHVYCALHQVNSYVYSFLLEMADLVKMICIDEYETEIDSLSIPVLRDILRRKCKWLQLCGRKTKLSLTDIQSFIQARNPCHSFLISIDSIKAEDLKNVLQFLKPIARKMFLQPLGFKYVPSEIAQVCWDFFNVVENPTNNFLLDELMESMLENHKDDIDKLCGQRKKMMNSESQRMKLTTCVYREGTTNTRIKLKFYLDTEIGKLLWHSCIKNAVKGISDAVFENGSYTSISVTIQMEAVGVVLSFLKPLVRLSTFKDFYFRCINPEIVRYCTDFTDGSPIPFVMIHTLVFQGNDNTIRNCIYEELTEKEEIIEKNCWIEFVRMVKCSHVYVDLHDLNSHIYDFFLELAEFTKLITITAYDQAIDSPPMPMTVVKRILTKECNWLQLYEKKNEVTLENVEDLLQFFHYSDKKIRFQSNFNAALTNIQIGEYIASTHTLMGECLWISHANWVDDDDE